MYTKHSSAKNCNANGFLFAVSAYPVDRQSPVTKQSAAQAVGNVLGGTMLSDRALPLFGGCMPVIANCLVCGKEIKVKPSHAANGAGKYCSRDCMAVDYKTRLTGETNPNYSNAGRHTCQTCGQEFFSRQKTARFCSVKCRANHPDMKEISRRIGKENISKAIESRRKQRKPLVQASMTLRQNTMKRYTCVVCGRCGWSYRDRTTCSKQCADEAQKKRVTLTCVVCGKQFDVPRSVDERGGQKTCSRECFRIYRSVSQQGEKSHRWQGGRTKQTLLDRQSLPYKMWRESVFARDKFTCQLCGVYGGRLAAHHIKAYAKHPQYRRDAGNGITLCRACHVSIKGKEEEYESQFFAVTGGVINE